MNLDAEGRRLLAEIELGNIVFNYLQTLACAPGCRVCCVIKANAYGHGAVPVARALAEAGASHFAVATPQEALQLRRHGIEQEILLLCPTDACWTEALAEQGITLAVDSLRTAEEYAGAAGNKRLKIHIKLDTGMARLGLPCHSAVEDILAIAARPVFEIDGLFTHFAVADEDPIIIAEGGKRMEGLLPKAAAENEKANSGYTHAQMARFLAVHGELRRRGLKIPLLHCACSAAIIAYPYTHALMVRPGIMLYGSNPLGAYPLPLKPALTLRARVAQVRQVGRGESVGYDRAWFAPRHSIIATVSFGYADGLTRFLSGKLHMLVRGQEARQVGRICMDMCMLDVTDIPGVEAGDYATVIGRDGDRVITADQIAQAAGTIPHEIFCSLGLRVPRLYYQDGQLLEQADYLDQL